MFQTTNQIKYCERNQIQGYVNSWTNDIELLLNIPGLFHKYPPVIPHSHIAMEHGLFKDHLPVKFGDVP